MGLVMAFNLHQPMNNRKRSQNCTFCILYSDTVAYIRTVSGITF